MRKFVLALAACAALVIPGSVLALSNDATVPQTVTIADALTVTGVPASMSFGTLNAGDSNKQGSPDLSASVSTSHSTGATTTITLSDFSDGHGNTIPATNESWAINAGSYTAYSAPYVALTTSLPGTNGFSSQIKLNVPASTVGGAFTASVSIHTQTNP